MAFNIILQNNASDKNVLDKSISDVLTLSGVLREETSLMSPKIKIAADASIFGGNVNYFTIPAFGRSYYLTDVVSINNGIVEISGKVDVLYTYRNEIRANDAIIYRQQNRWNLYLNDGSFKVYQNPMVLTREFPGGFENMEFVLAVAGSTSNSSSQSNNSVSEVE